MIAEHKLLDFLERFLKMKIFGYWQLILIILSINPHTTAEYYSPVIKADSSVLTLQKFDVSDGLSQGTIYCSFQDSRGFLWFGTQFGLNRFDGYTYKVFLNNPSDSTSISSNQIYAIIEDRRGCLWVGTENGLNQYNPNSNTFRQFFHSAANNNTISSNFITSLVIDNYGNIWAGTNCGGLNFLSLNNNSDDDRKFTHFMEQKNNPGALKSNIIRSLFKDSKGRIWIGTSKGLALLEDFDKGKFKQILNSDDADKLLETNIWAIKEDNFGRILIGTSSGIYFVNEQANNIYFLDTYFNSSMMSEFKSVISFGEDNSGNLFFGTAGNGIYLWNENQNLLSKISTNDKTIDLNSTTTYSILLDKSKVFWIGTKTGLLKRNTYNSLFKSYQHLTENKRSLSDNLVFALMEDNNGKVWIGTETGLNIFDPVNDQFTNVTMIDENYQRINCREIKSIYQDSENVIWIGTMWDGLFKINSTKKNSTECLVKNYWFDVSKNANLFNYAVFSIREDKWSNLWIATSSGVKIFNKEEEKFYSLEKMLASDEVLPKGIVFDIHKSSADSDIMWVGTGSEGLFKFVLGSKKNEIHLSAIYKPWHTNISHSIRTILEDKLKRIWIGTLNSGLYVIDEDKPVVNYSKKNGLSNNAVTGILEDDLGNIWISTISGLNIFDYNSKEFINFHIDDGIQGNEFNGGALLKCRAGELYFGGTEGFSIIHPEKGLNNFIIPDIRFTDIQLFNKSINLLDYMAEDANSGSPSSAEQVLNFSYDQNVLSFEFSALHFVNPALNQYAYMLEGVDSSWNYLSHSRKVTYAHLDPGTYLLKVIGSNNNNVWNNEGASIMFIISPPFWSTWWFRISSIILFILSFVLMYRKRIQIIELKKKALEQQVKEKSEAEEKTREMLLEVERLKKRVENENIYLKDEIKLVHNFENIISVSEKFKKVLGKVEQVSSVDSTVLILGESGTGKELLARAIHNLSNRKNRPLIKVDCSTLSTSLIESELFGYEKGAFTGAVNHKPGRFELADGGTIFLDEIGELPLEMQTKLLRILQDGEFERLGSTCTKKVDVRIISATNRDLEEAVKVGKFREDLFYRLNVFPIKVPPLRERKEDIPFLVNHFIARHSQKAGKYFAVVNGRIMEELMQYDWPGNIRELENVIERTVIVSGSGKLTLECPLSNNKINLNNNGYNTLEEIERQYIIKVLSKADWRVSGDKGAAKILGLKPTTLEYRMKKLGIIRR